MLVHVYDLHPRQRENLTSELFGGGGGGLFCLLLVHTCRLGTWTFLPIVIQCYLVTCACTCIWFTPETVRKTLLHNHLGGGGGHSTAIAVCMACM